MSTNRTAHRPTPRPRPGTCLLLALCLLVGPVVACSGVDEDDLRLWTRNAEGLKRIEEVMQNPELSQDLRLRALELMVDNNLGGELGRMLDRAADRKELAPLVAAKLRPRLKGGTEEATAARDALLRILRYLSNAEQEATRKALAGWVFEGLDASSDKEKVQRQVPQRISVGRIKQLGGAAVEGAALLVSHGFALSDLGPFLAEQKSPAAKRALAQALLKLHKDPEIAWTIDQLAMLAETEQGIAFEPALALYQDGEQDEDVRVMALNAAMAAAGQALRDKRTSAKAQKALKAILGGRDVDDRWIAMNVLIASMGDDGVRLALSALTDDPNWLRAEEDPRKSVVDFCGDTLKKHAAKSHDKILAMMDDPKLPLVRRAVSVVCAKVWQRKDVRDGLTALAAEEDSPKLDRILPDVPTLAVLSQNALDGMLLLGEIDALEKVGKIPAKEAELRRFYGTVLLDKTGADLRKDVDEAVKE